MRVASIITLVVGCGCAPGLGPIGTGGSTGDGGHVGSTTGGGSGVSSGTGGTGGSSSTASSTHAAASSSSGAGAGTGGSLPGCMTAGLGTAVDCFTLGAQLVVAKQGGQECVTGEPYYSDPGHLYQMYMYRCADGDAPQGWHDCYNFDLDSGADAFCKHDACVRRTSADGYCSLMAGAPPHAWDCVDGTPRLPAGCVNSTTSPRTWCCP
jgi:hypothetical protein